MDFRGEKTGQMNAAQWGGEKFRSTKEKTYERAEENASSKVLRKTVQVRDFSIILSKGSGELQVLKRPRTKNRGASPRKSKQGAASGPPNTLVISMVRFKKPK